MGANGAVTFTVALGKTYSAANSVGIWFYFPAGAVFSGSSAGIYWTVMTSTTAGTVYNNTYTSGVNTPPASPTPVVDAGPGAFTAPSTEITLISLTIPGGIMGPRGTLRKSFRVSCTSSANNKTVFERINGTATGIGLFITTNTSYNIISQFSNRGLVTGNQSSSNAGMSGASSVAIDTNINTNADMTYTLTGTYAAAGVTAGEYFVYENLIVELIPG
jgi:hypothetical protein